MKPLTGFTLLILLGLCGLADPVQAGLCTADVCVRIEPPSTTVNLNDVFNVDIVADINTPVVGWGLDLIVDTPVIVSRVGDPIIPSPPWAPFFAPDGDKLAAVATPVPPFSGSVSGTGVLLASLSFSADSVGETDLLLSYNSEDPTEGFALDPTGFAEVMFESSHVTVIPEPASALWMLSGGVLMLRRPRSRRQ